ncbi:hypothetical protein IVB43_23940 [Bradyrhizobium sp. 48]|uniref:hypothetical protein n=1 Tax=Bradyrhizobium sp. 48 TaxID=2782676 RepID=UPI001FF7EE5D|nr:hypothetical protein [Bradyrhizobium sp. 48]MCK1445441.1 hypothetical protein [Bradyrhizobium sp. 48]
MKPLRSFVAGLLAFLIAAAAPIQSVQSFGLGTLGSNGGFGTSGSQGRARISPPVGFSWPFNQYPIKIQQSGPNSFTTNFVPESYAGPALAGQSFYFDCGTGNDANPGTSGSRVKSIWKATQLGNATGAPFNVHGNTVAGGCPRENGFSNVSTVVPNTQPAAYIIDGGGTLDIWTGSTLTWSGSPDPTFTTLYTATRAAVSQVINPTILDAYGDPIMATKYADAATANAASGSAWAQVGSTLYVKWAGGAAVTNTNTRALLQSTPNFVTDGTSKDVYLKGFNFQGGANGAVAMTAAATMNFIAVNVKACYSGDSTNSVNGFKLDFITGLAALVNSVGCNAEADGINSHWTPGGTPGLYTLTINSVGRNNGRDTVQSCNGLTSHDGVISIDVGGEYFGNFGANVIPINASQTWAVGTYAHDSQGDVGHGGATTPTDFQTQNTAMMWIQNGRSAVSATSLLASNTSTIKTRNFLPGGGQTPGAGGGTITTF